MWRRKCCQETGERNIKHKYNGGGPKHSGRQQKQPDQPPSPHPNTVAVRGFADKVDDARA